ncbi:ABC transporter substrate-binding protein [Candidatus Bipolaricaulota bacterium]|jgi:NitT/TauT family transport system substrate-binding protein|nr:ABC transporter substrate-binding protein [Candidatus Bipolaricaulota bacterium]
MKKPVLALLALALFACSVTSLAVSDIAIGLKWYHQAQFAGFYIALDNGIYEDADLSVTLIEGGPEIDKINLLLTGIVDFVVDSPEDLLIHRQAGDDVVAVAVLYQRSPLVFITRAESGILRPHDFIGKSAAILSADQNELQFFAMVEKLGLDVNQVLLLPYDYDYSAFYEGSIDITLSYVNGGLIRLRDMGYGVNIIWPGDYGVRGYSDTLITTQAMIDEHPDVVQRVVRASLAGWEQAISRPEQAVDSILRYAREPDRRLQREMMLASIPLLAVGTTPIGWMDLETWTSMIHVLTNYGVLAGGLDPARVYDQRFVQAIYGQEANR